MWQTHLSTSLGLTAVEVEDIELNWPRDASRQRVEMFRRWKEKMKSQATYRYVYEHGKDSLWFSIFDLV